MCLTHVCVANLSLPTWANTSVRWYTGVPTSNIHFHSNISHETTLYIYAPRYPPPCNLHIIQRPEIFNKESIEGSSGQLSGGCLSKHVVRLQSWPVWLWFCPSGHSEKSCDEDTQGSVWGGCRSMSCGLSVFAPSPFHAILAFQAFQWPPAPGMALVIYWGTNHIVCPQNYTLRLIAFKPHWTVSIEEREILLQTGSIRQGLKRLGAYILGWRTRLDIGRIPGPGHPSYPRSVTSVNF